MIFNTLLGKLFRIREDSAQRNRGLGADDGFDNAEMPFLDHLEDLRKMLFRIIITLLIAMILCFSVNDRLLDWIRLPMEWAKIGSGGPAFFVSKEKKDAQAEENAIKVNDWVVTRGGIVGQVTELNEEARLTGISVGDAPKAMFQTSELVKLESQETDEETAEASSETAEDEASPPEKAETDNVAEPAEPDIVETTEAEAAEADVSETVATDASSENQPADAKPDPAPSDRAEEKTGLQPGDQVKTPAGLIGTFVEIDEKSQTAIVEIGKAPELLLRSSAIATKLQQRSDIPESETLDANDPRSLVANQNFLIMEVFQPYEALVLTLKLAFFAGLVLSFPLVTFFIAQFVLPGLRQVEKQVIFPSLFVGFFLFLLGAFFAFRVGLPLALDFLAQYTLERGIEPGWRIGYYIKFVTQVTLVFGLAFELPVVVMSLVSLGLLTYRTMRDSRAYAIVILMVLSAFLTPPDPMTLLLLSVPLVLLYEICIWLAYFLERKQLKQEAAEERQRAEERAKREEERARKEEERQAKLAAGEELTEDEKREAVAGDIERYESTVTDDDVHALDHHDDPHHGDDHTGESYDDPHHDWDHDYHEHDPHHHMPAMVDINHATVEELQQLPGVGPKLAERLIEARPYYSEDELEFHAHLPKSVIKLILDRIYYG